MVAAGSNGLQTSNGSFENGMGDRRVHGLIWAAVAAAVALIAGVLWFFPPASKNTEPPFQDAREVKPADQIAREGQTANPLRLDVDLRAFVTSGKETNDLRQPLALPRRRLYVTVSFPSGFGPGPYEIQVVDSERRPRASASGPAVFRGGTTTLQTTLDLTSLPSGAYRLAVRRQGEDWHLYPARVQ
jgi:hypothetical protein